MGNPAFQPPSHAQLLSPCVAAGATCLFSVSGTIETSHNVAASYGVNVKTFGAAGDGLSYDVPAIQCALDAAHTAGGGIVSLPPGRDRTGNSLIVPGGVTLRGSFGCVPPRAGLRDRGQPLVDECGAGKGRAIQRSSQMKRHSAIQGLCSSHATIVMANFSRNLSRLSEGRRG
jgi:pectate lyase-like protein